MACHKVPADASSSLLEENSNSKDGGGSIVSVQRRKVLVAGLAAATTAMSEPARAQPFPSKPIRFIVPFAAGGNADVTARIVGEGMSRKLGQAIIVDNRPGAGGVVGQELTLQAPHDGYTMVIGGFGTLYVSPLMAGKPSMVPAFAPVGMLTTVPMIVVVPANSRFADWPALMAAAKAKPGGVSLGHAGNGTPNHTDILRLQENEKVSFNIVPYRGSGVGLNDVLAGQIDGYVDQLSSSLPHLQSGKLRALVVIGEKRIPELPNVPTLAEKGAAAFDGGTTLGIYVRADTPAPLIAALNAAIVAALADPPVRQKLVELGATVRSSTSEEFAAFMKTEEAGIGDLAKKGLLKPE
jgi:tripartite-type tricarboxylate transporter receptor subunit TctC